MNNKKVAIFDLDGTLLNTIGDLAVACNHMLRLRNLNEHTYDDYCHFVGNGITRLVERALPEELRTPEYIASARRDFIDFYIEHIDHHTCPYEGIEEMLSELSDAGVLLAVASNKFNDGTRKLINRFFVKFTFASVYGNRENVPLKPAPDVLNEIAAECGVDASACFMVGDSGVDMDCAKSANIRSIGVTWGFRCREELKEHCADSIVDTPQDVVRIILGK